MLKICLTFDYELFLGKNNASYQEILFQPTENIMNTLSPLGVSGTFFADVCSVYAHKKLGDVDYCERFKAQIIDLIKHGQDVQLHLHTNWLNAEVDDGKIIPGKEAYRIHSLGFDNGGRAHEIIRKGKEYLEDACSTVDENYKCIAYRAGGFSVQPEKELFEALLENGIVIDSSVVPHMKAETVNYYDFRKVPNRMNWWIDPQKGISEESEENSKTIFEVPIATTRPRLLQVIGKPKSELGLPPHKVLGEYVKSDRSQKKQGKIVRQFHRLFDYRYVSLDTRYFMRVMEDLDYLFSRYRMDKQDGYICLICHPKLADPTRVENIRKLVVEIEKYPEKYSIVNFSDIYRKICK